MRFASLESSAGKLLPGKEPGKEQLALFFVRAAAGSDHEARVEGWHDASEVRATLREAAQRFEAEQDRRRRARKTS